MTVSCIFMIYHKGGWGNCYLTGWSSAPYQVVYHRGEPHNGNLGKVLKGHMGQMRYLFIPLLTACVFLHDTGWGG
ncbi:hypothetical protein SAMN04487981_106372 [Streptomyces sp. cf386]|nr:hypothetical protein SAMN04487981_106372 [Streptomyces sp. cf386]